MKNIFGSLFGKEQQPQHEVKPAPPECREGPRLGAGDLYGKGDVIGGTYEVHGTLGKGGFGVVYLAYDRQTREVCALKTFRDELLADATAREAFRKEALLWVNLGEHPFILTARFVAEFSGRLFVKMEHVAPDAHGRVSLADHLARAGSPIHADQTLKWAIQFCLGMEHAKKHGIECHRDIKPANILINRDGKFKISDFGLAAAAEMAWRAPGVRGRSLITGGMEGVFGLSLMQTAGMARCGTPGYMAPEVYRGEEVDTRSDLYSFGLVLWQMATGSRVPPFLAPYRGDLEGCLRETYEQQMVGRLPRVEGSLGSVVERCLRAKPSDRYTGFEELRGVLEPMLERKTGLRLDVSQGGEKTAAFWNNKGASLDALGRHDEAIRCLDEALAVDPRYASAWSNKGAVLDSLGRREEAVACYDQALAIEPRQAAAWSNKGLALVGLGRREEAIKCFDRALVIDARDATVWSNKGNSLAALGRRDEAVACYDQALAIDPRIAAAWFNKGNMLADFRRPREAIACYDQALAIDPRYVSAYYNKGVSLDALGRCEEAIKCYDQALAIEPRNAAAWYNKGVSLDALGRPEEAVKCYNQALAIDSRFAIAWCSKGTSLDDLDCREEAIACFDRALAIDPRCANAWNNKGSSLGALGRGEEAIACFDHALAIDPRYAQAAFNKGVALSSVGRRKEAIVCYDQVLDIDPRFAEAWTNKGASLAALGRREEAIACYNQVLDIDPQCADAWYNKAVSENALGHRREAMMSYRKFIELAPPQYAQIVAQARQRLLELEAQGT